MKYKSIFLVIAFLLTQAALSFAATLHPEKAYQTAWCEREHGVQEYVLDDKTRVDCLLPDYAIEFDFAHKWAESVGQALYYGLKTNRTAGVVLIIEDKDKDETYLIRLEALAEKYNIKVWTITPADLP